MLTLAWPWVMASWPLLLVTHRLLPPARSLGSALRWTLFGQVFPAGADRSAAPPGRRWITWLLWTLLVLSAARPEWIERPTGTPVSGRSLLLAVDVSASMRNAHLGQEIAMAAVRRTARTFVRRRIGDRVGLVLFGTQPYVQAPLTFDLEAVGQMVNDAVIGLAGEGTALGDALALSVSRLRALADEERVLVLLSDGANTSGVMTVDEALVLARAHRVRIYTIGVQTVDRSAEQGPDIAVLNTIASETGGKYFHATDPVGLERIYADLDGFEPIAESTSHLRVARTLHHWPLAAGLAIALLALVCHFLARWRSGRG